MDNLALDTALRERILRFHRARLSSPADAEDLTQQTLMRIASRAETLKDEERAEAWMMRIAKNALIDFYRKRARAKEALSATGAVPIVLDEARLDEEDDASLREEMQTWLVPFVNALDEPYAEALRLVELEGLTQREAATRVGISLSGMKSRVQRGRVKLRDTLHACCAFDVDARGKPVGYRYKGETCACVNTACDDEPAAHPAHTA